MKIRFASRTANNLAFRLDDTTPMERAFARQYVLDRLAGMALEAGCRSVEFAACRVTVSRRSGSDQRRDCRVLG